MYTYIYIYIYIYLRTCMYVYMYIYMYVDIYTYIGIWCTLGDWRSTRTYAHVHPAGLRAALWCGYRQRSTRIRESASTLKSRRGEREREREKAVYWQSIDDWGSVSTTPLWIKEGTGRPSAQWRCHRSSKHVFMYVCMYVCTYVRIHVCIHACMYACIYIRRGGSWITMAFL
jgi:hypothetical protein